MDTTQKLQSEQYVVGEDYTLMSVVSRDKFDLLGTDWHKIKAFQRCAREGGINFRAVTTVAMIENENVRITTYMKADRRIQ